MSDAYDLLRERDATIKQMQAELDRLKVSQAISQNSNTERDAEIERLQAKLAGARVALKTETAYRTQLGQLSRQQLTDAEASLETETARCTRLEQQLADAERRSIQPGDIVYRPVIEEGKPAVRPPKEGEYYVGCKDGIIRCGGNGYINPYPIVRRVDAPEAAEGEAAEDEPSQATAKPSGEGEAAGRDYAKQPVESGYTSGVGFLVYSFSTESEAQEAAGWINRRAEVAEAQAEARVKIAQLRAKVTDLERKLAEAEPCAQAMRDVERYGIRVGKRDDGLWGASDRYRYYSLAHASPLAAIQDVVKKIEAAKAKLESEA